jgi:hypothetical protein
MNSKNPLFITFRSLLTISPLALAATTAACVASTGSEGEPEQSQSVADRPATDDDAGPTSNLPTPELPEPPNGPGSSGAPPGHGRIVPVGVR